MKIKIQVLAVITLLILSTSANAQYKHDIGLRMSTFDLQQSQLEYRFHLESPYTIVVSALNGNRGHGTYSQSPLYNDSLFSIAQNGFRKRSYGLNIGVQRKITGLASDVFYVGAHIGGGMLLQDNSLYSAVYAIPDTTGSNGNYLAQGAYQVSSSSIRDESQWISTQLGLSFGMDVPLTKRFSLNAEISIAGFYDRSLTDAFSSFTLMSAASGGIRYRFGKRE